jgi:hypothetical protein
VRSSYSSPNVGAKLIDLLVDNLFIFDPRLFYIPFRRDPTLSSTAVDPVGPRRRGLRVAVVLRPRDVLARVVPLLVDGATASSGDMAFYVRVRLRVGRVVLAIFNPNTERYPS